MKVVKTVVLAKSGKKKKCILGVADSKIAAPISEEIGVSCQHTGVVPEIIRGKLRKLLLFYAYIGFISFNYTIALGIRLHFPHFVKGLTETGACKAQLGLGHSYSRAKVKFNVNRSDNMIIQSISLLDQLDKDVNTFSMRIR